jgi:single-stranded DNA-specific DHH superfamily exonuclease
MINHNRRGYTTVKPVTKKTGRLWNMAVSKDSPIAKKIERERRKFEKAQRERKRIGKAQLREAKKNVPIELRSKVNWNNLTGVNQ